MGFTGKSTYKQTVPWSLSTQDHSLFAEGLPVSDNIDNNTDNDYMPSLLPPSSNTTQTQS